MKPNEDTHIVGHIDLLEHEFGLLSVIFALVGVPFQGKLSVPKS